MLHIITSAPQTDDMATELIREQNSMQILRLAITLHIKRLILHIELRLG